MAVDPNALVERQARRVVWMQQGGPWSRTEMPDAEPGKPAEAGIFDNQPHHRTSHGSGRQREAPPAPPAQL